MTRVTYETPEKSSFLFNMVLLLVPIYVGRIQELIPSLERFSIAKIAMVISLFAYLQNKSKYIDSFNDFKQIPQSRYITVIMVLALIGIPFSDWPGGSIDVFEGFLKMLLFIYLLVKCVNTEEKLLMVIRAYCLSALALATVALISPYDTLGRIYVSSTYDPNDLALILTISLPLLFYLQEDSKGGMRLLLIATMGIIAVVVLKTGSRGGFVTLIAVTAMLLYQKGARYALKCLPFFLVFAAIIVVNSPPEQLERMMTVFGVESSDPKNTPPESRTELWKLSWGVMMESPVFGCGLGQLTSANGRAAGGNWHTAHNAYLQIGAELGVAGLAAFIAMLVNSFKSLHSERFNFIRPWLADGVMASLFGLCVGSVFLSWAYQTGAYFIIAMTIIIHKLSLQNRRAYAG